MNTNLEEPERKAKAAIVGPYNVSNDYPVFVSSEGVKWKHSDEDIDEEVDSFVANAGGNVEQAEYIAALDPATVLELCRLASERVGVLTPCVWKEEDPDGAIFVTGCGEEFWFDEPPDGILYCAHCGHPAKIEEAKQ